MKKFKEPIIKDNLNITNINNIDIEDKIYDCLFENSECNIKINNAEFNGCVFKNINFNKYPISNTDFIDCKFEACDLSNFDINGKLILRCSFNNCSLVGTSITESSIKQTTFNECNSKYIN